MNVVINPQYESYRPLIESLPTNGFAAEHVFCNRRNLVAVWQMGDRRVVVKRFRRPTLANCVIYTWFRPNKALRAYENALLLQDYGIDTPAPVAYIVIRRWGFVHTCYFLSEYLPWPTLGSLDETLQGEEREALWKAYMEFARRMHRMRLLLRDNNVGNTLVQPDSHFHFALVDINRLQVGIRPRWHQIVFFFYQLGLPLERLLTLLPYYREVSEARLHRFAHDYHAVGWWRRWKHTVKHCLKRLIPRRASA